MAAARGVVPRALLYKRLSGEGVTGVVVVCAPAGSGKTVLVRSWLQATGREPRSAWVSVERGEQDAQRFWLSVIDALGGVAAEVQRVDPAPTFRGQAVVERLLSDLAGLSEPAILVIDDLHELESRDARAWLELFLLHLPPRLRVVLATREDPRLGLHRLRLAGQVTELRGSDLRFSVEETDDLLRGAGISLSARGVALLYERTEGWVAGIRLAAISLAQHLDPERFVAEFSGSERTVAGYLMEEVLEHQPAEVRDMLLRTSLLERVSGPLADYLTGGSGSERILQDLEDSNAFVTSVDVGRSWFRYHHLFADLLQLELRRGAPESIASLHRVAAEWFEQEGFIVDAVRHAEAAHDWALASRVLAENSLELTLDGRAGTVRQLLSAFPESVVTGDAELALVFGTAHLMRQERETGTRYVELAQQLGGEVPEAHRQRFNVSLAVLRLLIARWRGDLATALAAIGAAEAAVRALSLGEGALSDAMRSAALQNLGIAELWSSRIDEARRDLEEALALARRAGRPWLEIPCLGHLGIAGPWTDLTLSEGLELSERAVVIADEHGWSEDPIVVTALATGMIDLLWLGRLDEAERWLERADRTLHPEGEPGTEMLVHHARGLLRLAHGQLDEALSGFRAAERMQNLLADRHPFAQRTQARVLQVEARLGHTASAEEELARLGKEKETAEMRLTAAVIDLAADEPELAIDALAPVIAGRALGKHRSSTITEAQVLDAVARERLRDHLAAEVSLERALDLAESEGIILPFLLAPVQELLEGLPRHRTAHPTLRQTILDVLAGNAPGPRRDAVPALGELSEAELRVVRYLPTNLRAPEIAAELYVSTNTIRTHLRHIYAKLDAHGRAEAVARARELGLLAPARSRG